MLQTMRSSAKIVMWILLISFVGGFLLFQTSGLMGSAPVTSTTSVASVNGRRTHEAGRLEQQETADE